MYEEMKRALEGSGLFKTVVLTASDRQQTQELIVDGKPIEPMRGDEFAEVYCVQDAAQRKYMLRVPRSDGVNKNEPIDGNTVCRDLEEKNHWISPLGKRGHIAPSKTCDILDIVHIYKIDAARSITISEYCEKTLAELSSEEARKILRDPHNMMCILSMLDHFKKEKIVHFGLNPNSIYVRDYNNLIYIERAYNSGYGNTLALGNFELMRKNPEQVPACLENCAANDYFIAPEAMNSETFDRTDLWSLGIILYQTFVSRDGHFFKNLEKISDGLSKMSNPYEDLDRGDKLFRILKSLVKETLSPDAELQKALELARKLINCCFYNMYARREVEYGLTKILRSTVNIFPKYLYSRYGNHGINQYYNEHYNCHTEGKNRVPGLSLTETTLDDLIVGGNKVVEIDRNMQRGIFKVFSEKMDKYLDVIVFHQDVKNAISSDIFSYLPTVNDAYRHPCLSSMPNMVTSGRHYIILDNSELKSLEEIESIPKFMDTEVLGKLLSSLAELHRLEILLGYVSTNSIGFDEINKNMVIRELYNLRDYGDFLDRHNDDVKIGSAEHPYLAPEILRGDHKYKNEHEIYSKKSDIYALGVLLYHMVTGSLPWEDVRGSKNKVREQLSHYLTDQVLVEVISAMMEPNPNERPTVYELLTHMVDKVEEDVEEEGRKKE
ncbi:MAG: protein kinase [Rickettsiales bacterium]|nr:protein kinase [Rickettsiales bacterium]